MKLASVLEGEYLDHMPSPMLPAERESRIPKLPVWAQDAIAARDQRIKNLTARLDELTSGNPGSRVVADPHGEWPQHLPDDEHIQFNLFERREGNWTEYIQVYINNQWVGSKKQNVLVIQGSYGILIEPSASNSCRIILREN